MRPFYPLLALFYFALFLFYKWGESNKIQFNYPAPTLYQVYGLDMSHHQGEVDWTSIDTDRYSFVYLKATEGENFVDKRFEENYKGARKAGLKVGAYHFWSFCRDPQTQIDNIVSQIPKTSGDLVPAVDFETIKDCDFSANIKLKDLIQQHLRFAIEELSEHYDNKPLIYTTMDFSSTYPVILEGFEVFYWVRSLVGPPILYGHDWLIWQYHNSGSISGVEGPVDLNVMKDPQGLKWLTQP